MPITERHRKRIIYAYCVIFYVLMLMKLYEGLFLYQLKPFLFNIRFDLVTWILMKTGLHLLVIKYPIAWLVFDIVFYAMPLLYLWAFLQNKRIAVAVAIIMLLVNCTYIQCITLFPSTSIEGSIAWLLFPFLFICFDLKSFYLILNGLRYFFLFFFTSAGIWKLVQGGIFNIDQMSGILLFQHKELLTSSPGYWYTNFTYWLINHIGISYLLYLFATVLELFFLIGFFTKKFDRYLAFACILFLLADLLLMRIHYWEVTPFLITLIYSKHQSPDSLAPAKSTGSSPK